MSFILLIITSLDLNFNSIFPFSSYLWLLVALGILMFMVGTPLREMGRPLLCAMVIGIVGLSTVAAGYYVYTLYLSELLFCCVAAGLLLIPLLVCGAKCRKSCLPNAIATWVIVSLCLLALLPLGVLSLIDDDELYFLLFNVVLFILAFTIVPLQVRFIHGRMHYVPVGYERACSLGIYADAWVFLFCAINIYLTTLALLSVPHSDLGKTATSV
ncbi:uncharacterized protein LOC108098716 isoform X1 [Drosophila ficusphila]|uniref:uncharacterized protein LOC108098716 isoform X1 n=2 Tax=Drosophila ficusphila TaxID=30025 RepID=UPI001C89727D|nr:uncharacterized protein LOC108098716 isoform X1 [Drosophila ficusphila]